MHVYRKLHYFIAIPSSSTGEYSRNDTTERHKSLVLLSTIALLSGDTSVLLNSLEITNKQYYSRMSALVKVGLIMRKNGDYFLTSLGKVVYEPKA